MARKESKGKAKGGVKKPPYELPPAELVVLVHPEAGVRVGPDEITAASVDTTPLEKAINAAGVDFQPLFGASEDRLQHEAATMAAETGAAVPNLSIYYRAEGAKDPDALAQKLAALDSVEAAYVKPPAEPPDLPESVEPLQDEPPTNTPDFTPRQGYLDPAPGGVDARYAWTRPGGDGSGVRVIDIEGAWRFSHEDLRLNQGGVIGGTESTDIGWRNHGTAVSGEIGGDSNAFGITGIAPGSNQRAISIFGSGMGSGQAIRQAANALSAGDIILIELHRPGPRNGFQGREDQRGYIAVEWWPDDFDAIRYATGRGVIVVEAAGNGAENLDDPLYNTPGPGFPAGWSNSFNRANRDSGAIVVGAGAPPQGTHGQDHGPDRSRLDFSNYGSVVDAQGWGREVTTCGYGDLQGGSNEDMWYTDRFSGTSSASPIVTASLACLQGVARANGKSVTPADARSHLRATGSPQQASPAAPASQRIGNRPDLHALIGRIVHVDKRFIKEKELHKEKVEKLETKEKEIYKEKLEIKEKREKEVVKEKELGKEKLEREGVQKIKREQEGKLPVEHLGGSGLEGTLSHFIEPELRPDLGEGALAHEPDSAKLERDAASAKEQKDVKDAEKVREV